jgi:hypothetical protein
MDPWLRALSNVKTYLEFYFIFIFMIPSGHHKKMQGTSKKKNQKMKCPPTKMIFHFPNAPQTSKEKLHGVRYCLISLIKYEQVLTQCWPISSFQMSLGLDSDIGLRTKPNEST